MTPFQIGTIIIQVRVRVFRWYFLAECIPIIDQLVVSFVNVILTAALRGGKCATTSGNLILMPHFAFLFNTCLFMSQLSHQISQLPPR